jgi:hypothetical protein
MSAFSAPLAAIVTAIHRKYKDIFDASYAENSALNRRITCWVLLLFRHPSSGKVVRGGGFSTVDTFARTAELLRAGGI